MGVQYYYMSNQSIGRQKLLKKSHSEGVFPDKLHNLLDYAERTGLESVISWTPDGQGLMVHNPIKLTEILPLFFGQTQYRSFQRQLSMWYFDRIQTESGSTCFRHPYFIRGQKSLCRQMSRESFKRQPIVRRLKAKRPSKHSIEVSSALEDRTVPPPTLQRAANPNFHSMQQATQQHKMESLKTMDTEIFKQGGNTSNQVAMLPAQGSVFEEKLVPTYGPQQNPTYEASNQPYLDDFQTTLDSLKAMDSSTYQAGETEAIVNTKKPAATLPIDDARNTAGESTNRGFAEIPTVASPFDAVTTSWAATQEHYQPKQLVQFHEAIEPTPMKTERSEEDQVGESKDSKGYFQEGEVMEFEGRSFYFLDEDSS